MGGWFTHPICADCKADRVCCLPRVRRDALDNHFNYLENAAHHTWEDYTFHILLAIFATLMALGFFTWHMRRFQKEQARILQVHAQETDRRIDGKIVEGKIALKEKE